MTPRLAAERPSEADHDTRFSGSAAVECAFVAAGVLRGARLAPLRVWDVAGGVALLRAAGKQVLVEEEGHWRTFERFDPPLRTWRRALAIGDADVVRRLTA